MAGSIDDRLGGLTLSGSRAGPGAFGRGDADSAEVLDLRAERDALQDALKAAQLELAKEQAARVNAEAKALGADVSPSAAAGRMAEDTRELEALRDQLEAEQTEVLALQEMLRRAENESSATHKQALALREEMRTALSKLEEAEAQIEQATDRAHHLERLVETKDKAIRELTEATEKRIMESMQISSSGKMGEDDIWKLGLTHEQLSAIDMIIMKWRDGYTRKDQELFEASKALQDRDEQLSRVSGIVRRTMESIRAGYQRRSAEDPAFVGEGDERDEALLDADSFDGVEALLGSLAQFAANKSHKVLRLRQELHRKTEEISQLEDELQRSWSSASQKAESELELARHELAEKTAEAAELRISLGRKAEEAASALVEVRVLHEELHASKDTAHRLRNQLSAAEADAARVRQEASHMAVQDVSRMREELERAHAEVVPMKEQLNRRTREVRELNHMLKAWEAMRLGKDAQIASLMERCKRHEEEAAEKARSVDSLRRKLALAGRDPSSSGTSLATASRARHIHVHMHHQPSESGSEYELGNMTPSLHNSPGGY